MSKKMKCVCPMGLPSRERDGTINYPLNIGGCIDCPLYATRHCPDED